MKVSVIVPVYNSEKYLKRCLDSIIAQTYNNLEIIIVNDGSTDNSTDIIREYKKKDNRIKEINQKNQGCVIARLNGIKESTGQYCMFVDSDDWIELITIENLVQRIENTNADIIKFSFLYEPSHKIQKYIEKYNNMCFKEEEKQELYKMLLTTSDLNNLANQIVKRELFDLDNYNFKINIKQGEDLLVYFELFYKAQKIMLIACPYYHYFKNGYSITNQKNVKDIFENIKDILYVYHIEELYLKKFQVNEYIKKQVKVFILNSILRFNIKLLQCKNLNKQELKKLQELLQNQNFYNLIEGIEKKDIKDRNPIKKIMKLNIVNKKIEKNYKYRHIISLYIKIKCGE